MGTILPELTLERDPLAAPLLLNLSGSVVMQRRHMFVVHTQRVRTAQHRWRATSVAYGTLSGLDATYILQYKVGLMTSHPAAQLCASDWLFVTTPAAGIIRAEVDE